MVDVWDVGARGGGLGIADEAGGAVREGAGFEGVVGGLGGDDDVGTFGFDGGGSVGEVFGEG